MPTRAASIPTRIISRGTLRDTREKITGHMGQEVTAEAGKGGGGMGRDGMEWDGIRQVVDVPSDRPVIVLLRSRRAMHKRGTLM